MLWDSGNKTDKYYAALGFYIKKSLLFAIKCQKVLAKCAKEVYNDGTIL